jgi:hypothetical protein
LLQTRADYAARIDPPLILVKGVRPRDGGLAFGDMAAVFRAHRAELVRLAAFIPSRHHRT